MATEPKSDLVKARVARGTVVWNTPPENAGPGAIVELPAKHVAHLRARGILAAEDGQPVVPTGVGPVYDRADGPTVKPA